MPGSPQTSWLWVAVAAIALAMHALGRLPLHRFLCGGIFAMLVLAAFIEAFWSSIGWIPALVKYGVGATMWSLVLLWLGLGGRNAPATRPTEAPDAP